MNNSSQFSDILRGIDILLMKRQLTAFSFPQSKARARNIYIYD